MTTANVQYKKSAVYGCVLHLAQRVVLVFALGFALATLSGCPAQTTMPLPDPLPRRDAIDAYNRNIAAIPAFRGRVASWEAQFPTPEDDLRHEKELGGALFYRPPASSELPPRFYLQADAPLKKALVLGSNAEQYWLFSEWGEFGAWGRYEHLGKPCTGDLQIHPLTLLEFCGLRALPVSGPLPVYKIHPQAAIIEFVRLTPDGYQAQREIQLDRRTWLPTRITAYHADGHPILTSELSDYHPVGDAFLPASILVSWPDDDSFIRLRLTALKPDPKNRDPLFRRPLRLPDVPEYRQLDKDCE